MTTTRTPMIRRRPTVLLWLVPLLGLLLACGMLSDDSGQSAADSARAEAEPALIIENDLDIEICNVYISLSTEDVWGDNQLGAFSSLGAGETQVFDVTPGANDVRLEDCDNQLITEERDIDVDGPETIAVDASNVEMFQGTLDSEIVITNELDTDVCFIFISPSSADTWGSSRLGATEELGVGSTTSFDVPADTYDIRMLDCEQNQVFEEYGFEVDGMFELPFNPEI